MIKRPLIWIYTCKNQDAQGQRKVNHPTCLKLKSLDLGSTTTPDKKQFKGKWKSLKLYPSVRTTRCLKWWLMNLIRRTQLFWLDGYLSKQNKVSISRCMCSCMQLHMYLLLETHVKVWVFQCSSHSMKALAAIVEYSWELPRFSWFFSVLLQRGPCAKRTHKHDYFMVNLAGQSSSNTYASVAINLGMWWSRACGKFQVNSMQRIICKTWKTRKTILPPHPCAWSSWSHRSDCCDERILVH